MGLKQTVMTQVAFNKEKTVPIFVKHIIFIQTQSRGFVNTSGIYSKGLPMAEAITWLIL